ncbi:MAG: ankyrin repeat domain-containing protein [Rickettsiaceae bacterium]|nr:ankyrin repeat domain-containing protein [Rickettsiaceae bacterium]
MAKNKTEQATLTLEDQTKLDIDLIRAISCGKIETVQSLLDNPNINVNASGIYRQTALIMAVGSGKVDLVKLLL